MFQTPVGTHPVKFTPFSLFTQEMSERSVLILLTHFLPFTLSSEGFTALYLPITVR